MLSGTSPCTHPCDAGADNGRVKLSTSFLSVVPTLPDVYVVQGSLSPYHIPSSVVLSEFGLGRQLCVQGLPPADESWAPRM